MEENSEGLFSLLFGKLFRNKEDEFPMEKLILSAKEEGDLKADEVAMLLNVLRLGRKQVREIMVPRTDIVCAEVGDPLQEISRLIISHGHSRIPIYEENRDHIRGIIHAKDLLKVFFDPREPQLSANDIMRKPLFIPDTKIVRDMLQEFRGKKIHLAIALDEYGGTSGLVTFEDVLEEIVGEIEDEYDAPKPLDIQVLEDQSVLVSGRTALDELEKHLDLELNSEQVETVSGYLCELAGRVPKQGESYLVKGRNFTVKEADARQVHWIVIQPGPRQAAHPV
ncbi:MAG: hemolysin family protein [Thermodesulfobacteriota bacterium]|nr:hemolysin family protein [Thermodesulfobacteriota bacterium]